MILGITGSVGTGKTTVSKMFEKMGASRIDADALAHEAIEKGKAPYRKIVRLFGKRILRRDGSVNRKTLAETIFKDPEKRRRLNTLIHPYVIRRMRQEIRKRSGKRGKKGRRCVVVEVPLLHEAHLTQMFDGVITVSCGRPLQERRWVKGGGDLKDLSRRRASQLPLSYKKAHSDFIIDNSGTRQKTKSQVEAIWKRIHLNA